MVLGVSGNCILELSSFAKNKLTRFFVLFQLVILTICLGSAVKLEAGLHLTSWWWENLYGCSIILIVMCLTMNITSQHYQQSLDQAEKLMNKDKMFKAIFDNS